MEGGRHQRSQISSLASRSRLDRPYDNDGDQVTVDGSTMVHVQKGDSARGEKDTKIVRSAKNRPGKISQLRKYRQERRL